MIRYDLYDDMLHQVHLLVAGATGSGKSVVVNGMIYTIMSYSPNEKQLILIDPKRVELSEYKYIPHTLCYASEPADMVHALQYAMDICENRYKKMQACGLRMYSGSDIYIFIDEFADLILTQKRMVKPLIQRLAQIGRAARIHIVLCTQTPIREVLPTEIKCNFDSRVGLRTRSKQDSINIIGHTGLELLPRYGQGIYYTASNETLYYIPMINDNERAAAVAYWTTQTATRPHKAGLIDRFKRIL